VPALDPATLQRALEALRGGGVVAGPTETLMGLFADARSAAAVARVAALKGRPAVGAAIAVIAPDAATAFTLGVEITDAAHALAAAHWPGPLTLVMRAAPGLPAALLEGGTIGVRVPGPSPALQLVRAFGAPLTATSANRSGQPPCRDAAELQAVFGADLDLVLPGEPPGGAPSTLVDVTGAEPQVLRVGAIRL
jgi:L-threonylcarbamoyladenylate synthase